MGWVCCQNKCFSYRKYFIIINVIAEVLIAMSFGSPAEMVYILCAMTAAGKSSTSLDELAEGWNRGGWGEQSGMGTGGQR